MPRISESTSGGLQIACFVGLQQYKTFLAAVIAARIRKMHHFVSEEGFFFQGEPLRCQVFRTAECWLNHCQFLIDCSSIYPKVLFRFAFLLFKFQMYFTSVSVRCTSISPVLFDRSCLNCAVHTVWRYVRMYARVCCFSFPLFLPPVKPPRLPPQSSHMFSILILEELKVLL